MMQFSAVTFLLVAINLLVLYIVLKKILFKPVTNFMEKRTNSIKEAINNSEKMKSEAEELRHKYEEKLQSAKQEAKEIIDRAQAKAQKEYERILDEAEKESDSVLTKAREEIKHERDKMLRDIKGQVAGLALAAASKVMEANMDTDTNKELVERFMDEAGVA